MARRSAPRSSPKRRGRAKPSSPVRTASVTLIPRRLELREPPHAHAVCRQCGRIAEVSISGFDGEQLKSLAAGAPDGWAVDGISLSLTGTCARCRRGIESP